MKMKWYQLFHVVWAIVVLFALYINWWVVLPAIQSESWRWSAVLGFGIITPLYLWSAGALFYYGIFEKGKQEK